MVPAQAELALMEEVNTPELVCCELSTCSLAPPLAATSPVLALLLDAETLEFKAPELLCPLLMLPGGDVLVLKTPVRLDCDIKKGDQLPAVQPALGHSTRAERYPQATRRSFEQAAQVGEQ